MFVMHLSLQKTKKPKKDKCHVQSCDYTNFNVCVLMHKSFINRKKNTILIWIVKTNFRAFENKNEKNRLSKKNVWK